MNLDEVIQHPLGVDDPDYVKFIPQGDGMFLGPDFRIKINSDEFNNIGLC